jgi:quinol monooxygenase YgiN
MIVEYIRYTVDAARAPAFLEAYAVASEHLRASEHCLGYELSRCTEAADSFVLRIVWDSAAGHLEGFRKGPQFPPFLAAIRPYVGDIAEMRHYAPTATRWER